VRHPKYFPLLERGIQGDLEIHPPPSFTKGGSKGDEGKFQGRFFK